MRVETQAAEVHLAQRVTNGTPTSAAEGGASKSGGGAPIGGIAIFAIKIAIACLLLGWLVQSGRIDIGRLTGLSANWGLVLLCTFGPLSMFLTAVRWWYLLRIQLVPVSLGLAVRLTWIGYFAGIFLPGASAGDLAKAFLVVKRQPDCRLRAFSTVVADRLIGLYTFLLLGALAAGWILAAGQAPDALWGIAGTVSLMLLGMSVGLVGVCWGPARPLVMRWLPKQWARAMDESWDLYTRDKLQIVRCLMLSLLCNVVALSGFAAAAAALGLSIPLSSTFQVGPLITLANSVPVTPGGTGIGEAASDQLFAALGFDGGADVMLLVRGVLILASVPAVLMFRSTRSEESLRT